MKIKPALCLIAFLSTAPSLAAHAQVETPKAERPVWPPLGSTMTVKFKLSGSFGSGTREETNEWLGEVEWEGRRVIAYGVRGGAQSYWDKERRLVASVRDGKPVLTL